MTGRRVVLTAWLPPADPGVSPWVESTNLIRESDLAAYLISFSRYGAVRVAVADPTPEQELHLPLVACMDCFDGVAHRHDDIFRPARATAPATTAEETK